jgi:hypothetical protein
MKIPSMRVDDTNITNFIISYKGHGMTETAPITDTIGHVVAHENRHIAHYRNYARYHNKEITSEDISVRYAFVNGKIVAVAGKATATMKDKPAEKSDELQVNASKDSTIDITVDKSTKSDQKKMKLDVVVSRLEAALDRVSAKIDEAENQPDKSPAVNQDKITELKQKKIKLEEKKREIMKKRNAIDTDKLKDMVKDLLTGLNSLVDQAANLMKAIYGLKSGQQIKQNSDNNYSKEVSIPDYSMLFTGILLDTTV